MAKIAQLHIKEKLQVDKKFKVDDKLLKNLDTNITNNIDKIVNKINQVESFVANKNESYNDYYDKLVLLTRDMNNTLNSMNIDNLDKDVKKNVKDIFKKFSTTIDNIRTYKFVLSNNIDNIAENIDSYNDEISELDNKIKKLTAEQESLEKNDINIPDKDLKLKDIKESMDLYKKQIKENQKKRQNIIETAKKVQENLLSNMSNYKDYMMSDAVVLDTLMSEIINSKKFGLGKTSNDKIEFGAKLSKSNLKGNSALAYNNYIKDVVLNNNIDLSKITETPNEILKYLKENNEMMKAEYEGLSENEAKAKDKKYLKGIYEKIASDVSARYGGNETILGSYKENVYKAKADGKGAISSRLTGAKSGATTGIKNFLGLDHKENIFSLKSAQTLLPKLLKTMVGTGDASSLVDMFIGRDKSYSNWKETPKSLKDIEEFNTFTPTPIIPDDIDFSSNDDTQQPTQATPILNNPIDKFESSSTKINSSNFSDEFVALMKENNKFTERISDDLAEYLVYLYDKDTDSELVKDKAKVKYDSFVGPIKPDNNSTPKKEDSGSMITDIATTLIGGTIVGKVLKGMTKIKGLKMIPALLGGAGALVAGGGFSGFKKSYNESLNPSNLVDDVVSNPAKADVPKKKGMFSKIGEKLKVPKNMLSKIGTKGLGIVGKKIPGLGVLVGTVFAVQRAMAGDWTGAGLEMASGLASTLPGAGTGASFALDAAILARDAIKDNNSEIDVVTVQDKLDRANQGINFNNQSLEETSLTKGSDNIKNRTVASETDYTKIYNNFQTPTNNMPTNNMPMIINNQLTNNNGNQSSINNNGKLPSIPNDLSQINLAINFMQYMTRDFI